MMAFEGKKALVDQLEDVVRGREEEQSKLDCVPSIRGRMDRAIQVKKRSECRTR